MQSTSERRLAQNAYNILKQKGPELVVQRLICMKVRLFYGIIGSFRIMKQGPECAYLKANPLMLKEDSISSALCGHFKKAL